MKKCQLAHDWLPRDAGKGLVSFPFGKAAWFAAFNAAGQSVFALIH